MSFDAEQDMKVGEYASLLNRNLARLVWIRGHFTAALKDKKWNKFLEKQAANWEKERQEYNGLARRLRDAYNAKNPDEKIKAFIVQSKDKPQAVALEGLGLVPLALALKIAGVVAAIGVVSYFGSKFLKDIYAARRQNERVDLLQKKFTTVLEKLPPEQQAKYLREARKAEAILLPAAEEGMFDRLIGAWKGLAGSTQTALTLAGLGLVAYVGYNIYRGKKMMLGDDAACVDRWRGHLEKMAEAGLLNRTTYINEAARLLKKECRIPYREARLLVLRIAQRR